MELTEAEVRQLKNELLQPYNAVKVDNYFYGVTYEDLREVILSNNFSPEVYKLNGDLRLAKSISAILLGTLRKLYEDKNKWCEFIRELKAGGRILRMHEPEHLQNLKNLQELIEDEEFIAKVNRIKKSKKHGHLLCIYELFPENASKDTAEEFIKAKSENSIRTLFNYHPRRVKCLTDIGFVFEEYMQYQWLYKDKRNGKVNISSRFTSNKTPQPAMFFETVEYAKNALPFWYKIVEYKIIKGIDRDKHVKVINELNNNYAVEVAERHKVIHKPHKPHKKGADRKVDKDTKIFKDKDGVTDITAKQYAEKYGVTKMTAYRHLRKQKGESI